MEDISSGSELLLSMFPAFKSGRAAKIHFLEFSKDGPADLGNEFTCGSLGKQKNTRTPCTRQAVVWYVISDQTFFAWLSLDFDALSPTF